MGRASAFWLAVLHYAVALSDQPRPSLTARTHPPPAEGLLVQPLQGAAPHRFLTAPWPSSSLL